MIFTYEDKQILEDAASLIIYHVKRQPTIHKDDKDHIKRIIQHLSQTSFSPVVESLVRQRSLRTRKLRVRTVLPQEVESQQQAASNSWTVIPDEDDALLLRAWTPLRPSTVWIQKGRRWICGTQEAEHQKELDGVYNLFFVNNNWYFFLRLHQTLCSRLLRVYRQAERQLLEHRAEQNRERLLVGEGRREKANDLAMELRLKQPSK